jgi:nitrite reductase (NO-forming)
MTPPPSPRRARRLQVRARSSGQGRRGRSPLVNYHSATIFTLRTGIAEGRMVYLGVGGKIDGKVNPALIVHEGNWFRSTSSTAKAPSTISSLDQYAARSSVVVGKNASSTFSFVASKVGDFAYFCSSPATVPRAWRA